MKKVNVLIVALVFITIEFLYRTVESLKVANPIDDESNSIGVGKERKRKKVRNFLLYFGVVKWVYGGRDRTGKIILLPILPNANPSILACIHASGKKKEDKVACAKNIQTLGADPTYLIIPALMLSALTPMIDVLDKAKGDNAIGSAWFKVNKQLTKIMLLVQDVMDSNVPDSITICEFYGFTVHGKGGGHAQILEGFAGDVTGSSFIFAKVGPQGCCYDWKLWNAAHTTFVRLRPTTVAHCTILDQPPGSTINVSNDIIYGETVLEESQIIVVPTK